MSPLLTAQLLAILTAFGYASSSTAARFGMRTSNPITAILTLVWITLLLYSPAAIHALRTAPVDTRGLLWLAAAGMAAPGLAGTWHYMGIRQIGLSRSTSIVGSSPLFAVIIAVLVLGENARPLIYAGTLLIMAGITLLSHERKSASDAGNKRRPFWSGFLYASGAAFMFGVAGVLRKAGITLIPSVSVALCAAAIGALAAILLWNPFLPPEDRIRYGRKNIGYFLISATINSLAHFAYFNALKRAPISAVVPLAYTTPLFALVFSWLFFRKMEQLNARVIAGAVLVCGGAALVTLSRG
jgi:drug/metabolite transporter (DMT)-like permease